MARSLLHQYWDLPEGTECHRKAYASTSVGGAAGLIVSAYSIALKPPASFLEGVARTGRYTFTAAAIGAIFGLTTCVSAQVRGKPDDPLNYLIGGCAGGLTLGARAQVALPRGPHPGPAARTAASLSASVSTHIFKVRGAWHFILKEGRPLGVTAGVIAQLPSPDAALPPRSSQLRDRSRRLRLHGPHGRPGQDGPAGGLGGVRGAQGVSPRPGPHSPDCV
uniref:NADH dehydrogenase [ubiquinone] 1 alpha subcomplex subunit 11 n=1 Tax=Equus asinus TaxID=9793 RepID=A0A9L0J0Y3_EQUAS